MTAFASTDLVLKGTFTLGGTDVSDEVTGVIIKGTANDVQIPATLSAGRTHASGAKKYELQIDYLSTDGDGGTLFPALWAAVLTASKELAFTAQLRDGSTSASNPEWSGTIVVSAADVGGDQETLSTGSLTCTMTGEPTVTTS